MGVRWSRLQAKELFIVLVYHLDEIAKPWMLQKKGDQAVKVRYLLLGSSICSLFDCGEYGETCWGIH